MNGVRVNGVPGMRVAWALPSLDRGFYWHPVFAEFARLIPETVVFTSIWTGYLPGYEDTFPVRRWKTGRIIGWRPDRKFIWSSPFVLVGLVRFRPDVVFTSGFQLCSAYVLLAKFIMRWNVVLIWDGVSPEVTKIHRRPIRQWIRRRMAQLFDRAVTNTREGYYYLVHTLGMSRNSIIQEPYEVPEKSALTRPGAAANVLFGVRRPRFLFVGTICRPKGLPYLIEACAILARKGVRNFTCVLVGEDRDREMKLLAERSGASESFEWVGQVDYKDLGAYYEACDVFVFPTLGDIWGMVVLEAMAFGKPILCSHFAGSREMIHHGENGFIFDPQAPSELAEYMERLIREPRLITHMGARSAVLIEPYTPRRAAFTLAAVARSAAGLDVTREDAHSDWPHETAAD